MFFLRAATSFAAGMAFNSCLQGGGHCINKIRWFYRKRMFLYQNEREREREVSDGMDKAYNIVCSKFGF